LAQTVLGLKLFSYSKNKKSLATNKAFQQKTKKQGNFLAQAANCSDGNATKLTLINLVKAKRTC
jgi:hypothetical protein